MLLHEIAHCRAGDKGDTSTLSLFPYADRHYGLLVQHVTAQRVRTHLAEYVRGEVIRYELPKLRALQFTCHRALGGGVTTSLAPDAHGKSLGTLLLALSLVLD